MAIGCRWPKWPSTADCAGVRDRLPPYLKIASPDVVNRPTAVARRKLLLEHCKDLTDLLDESP